MKMPQKKLIIFGIIIIVAAGVSVAAAVIFSQQQISQEPTESETKDTAVRKTPTVKKAEEAGKRAFEGDVAGGAAEIDRAVEGTNDSNEKYTLYSHKATLLYNSGDVAGALAASLKAYEFKKSSDSAALVGQFSKELGNSSQALQYYKRAIELIDKTDPYADEDTEYYGSIIKEIEGGATNG